MDKKKHIISMIAIIIVVAGGAFYGGMRYDASKNAAQLAARGGQGGGFGGGRGMAGQGQGGAQRGGGPANGGAGDFSGGQVTAKDDTSITIKTRNGGSQIIFFSPSTTIDKSVAGTGTDLSVGQQITANGKSSPDGTLAAQNIQIRPAQPAGQGQ